MNLDSFVANIAELFDETDAVSLSSSTDLKSLDEWSSLIALSLIAMVDEEYDVVLKGDDIVKASTIQELFNTVQSKL